MDEADARKLLTLLQNEPIRYRAPITFDLLSGLRRGELLGLRWTDIDFDSETITIAQTSGYVAGTGIYVDTPKNKTSSRPLKLSRTAFMLLEEYRAWQNTQRELCGDRWSDKDRRIFTNEEGAPLVVVSRRLGHAQVSTTANIYAHVIASADEKAAQITEKFSDVLQISDKATTDTTA